MTHQPPFSGEARLDGEYDPEKSLHESANERETSEALSFPEGGARAWGVAAGAAGVLFCTLGYVNSFG